MAYFFHTVDHFIIIIYINEPCDQPLLFICLDILVQLCYILKMHRYKVLLLRRHLKQQACIVKSFYRDTPQFCLVFLIPIVHIHLNRVFYFLGEDTLIQLRDIFADGHIPPRLAAQYLLEQVVHPDRLPVIEENGIGYRQLFQQCILNNPILSRKFNQVF